MGLLASEMAYFSTVFKTEVTVTAQAREANKDQHFFIWCSILSQTCSMPIHTVEELPGPPARLPTE